VAAPRLESSVPVETSLPPPGPDGVFGFDPILASPVARRPDFRRRVSYWLGVYRSREAAWVPGYLERMSWFQDTVTAALAERVLPPSLRFLPIVESGYSPRAVSHSRAVGLWQLMPSTARGLGLTVSPLWDERRDPFKSTRAALAFLEDLHQRFGSWFLALAAYNAGPNRVERLLARRAPDAAPSDSLYWALRRYLPPETRDFVPKFFAAIELARRPARYGFEPVGAAAGRFAFDTVEVPDATTLDVVAEAAGASEEEIERLNPEVVRGITPPGRRSPLRVPPGSAGLFRINYARIPPDRRVTFVEHRVVRGETLTHIARRYGVSLHELRAANPGVRPRRLQIGQVVTVPIAPRAGTR